MSEAPILIGNWKMHGTRALLRDWADALLPLCAEGSARACLCPPAPLLREAAQLLDPAIWVGGQNLSAQQQGAHTGEISAAMLVEAGCRLALVGHSERRQDQRESDAEVAAKAEAALAAGLHPVVCVGETGADRDAGNTEKLLARQVDALAGLATNDQWVIAYEPVWAIGTGLAAEIADIEAAHSFIRQRLGSKIPLLYGGSVNRDNIAAVLQSDLVDGALIGSASLDPQHFFDMVRISITISSS